jgi:hypothetical protein
MVSLLASDEAPFVRLMRAIARVRSEVSFDDEPEQARSLHVSLRLGVDAATAATPSR